MTLRMRLPRLALLLAVALGAAGCSDSPAAPVRTPDPLRDVAYPAGCYLIDGRVYCTESLPVGSTTPRP
jgi:hypothetical protein